VPRPFRFDHAWSLPVARARVFAVLADVERYAVWWPQVRRVQRVDENSGWAWVRSALPYTLALLLTREVEDEETGELRVSIDGDLRGWSSWQVDAAPGGGTLARYAQEVTVASRAKSLFPALSAPVLRANHSWMMRNGERGLVAYLTPPAQ
jgi:Polyketide cyclase / dehydrase and lipid transport